MPRTLILTALLSSLALSLPAATVFAQDAATDATTPMDRAVGNLDNTDPDRTLSNAEVRRLQEEAAARQQAPAQAGVPVGETITPVRKTTTTYDERMDIDAPEAGGPDH